MDQMATCVGEMGMKLKWTFHLHLNLLLITKIKTEIFTLNPLKLRLITIVSLNNALLCLHSRIEKNNVKHTESISYIMLSGIIGTIGILCAKTMKTSVAR